MKRELLQVHPALLKWLQEGSGWKRLSWPLRVRLHWMAAWAGLNHRLSLSHTQHCPPLQDPVFVLGPWRSGSTAMHELLVAATGLPTPQTWQCMNAPAFALRRAPTAAPRTARPMDGLLVSALTPQEDEFALLSLGGDSLYRAFWQPDRCAELLPLLLAQHWQQHTQRWLPDWERFLQGVLHSLGRSDEPLLLKSPNHSLRWAALRHRFPTARAVWMLRNAANVYHSNLKMWRQMAALHGLAPAPDGALEDLLSAALHAVAAALRAAMQSERPPVLVWQEHLREHPREAVQSVCSALDLPAQLDGPAFVAALEAVAKGRTDHYRDQQLPEPAAAGVAALDHAQAEAWAVARAC